MTTNTQAALQLAREALRPLVSAGQINPYGMLGKYSTGAGKAIEAIDAALAAAPVQPTDYQRGYDDAVAECARLGWRTPATGKELLHVATPAAEPAAVGAVDERERFEYRMTEDGYELDYLILQGSDRYAYVETSFAFAGWLAAKQEATQPAAIKQGWDVDDLLSKPAPATVAGDGEKT